MYDAQCLNLKTMKMFYKTFETFYQLKAFIIKCYHSKTEKIKVLGFGYDSQEQYLELSKYL